MKNRQRHTVSGELFGWFETGTEGILPAIQDADFISEDKFYDYKGLHVIKPFDHLTIYSHKTSRHVLFSDIVLFTSGEEYNGRRGGIEVKTHKEFGCYSLDGFYTPYLPLNVDIKLWFKVFFQDKNTHVGLLKKAKSKRSNIII